MAPRRETKLNKSAREFRALMESAGWNTQQAAAEAIGTTERTVRKWANGEPIPEPIIRFVRAIVLYRIKWERLLEPLT